MNKIDVTYIGSKPIKKDTVTGSRLVFPRLKSVPVEADIAHQLLDYPKVWVPSEDAKDIIAKQEANAKAIADKLVEEEAASKKQDLDNSMLVIAESGELDIAKYSGKQLETLVEANDLVITVNAKPVKEYREAIRDALREKNGIPELDSEE